MKKYAVIVAGGSGTRMGSVLPKQFIEIHGRPLLWYTLTSFLQAAEDFHLIVVLPGQYYEAGVAICRSVSASNPIRTIIGGQTRFHSVQKGLEIIMDESKGPELIAEEGEGPELIKEESIICVHDAVRCLVTSALIQHCINEAELFGSAIPCIDSKDSVRVKTGSAYVALKRTEVKLVQTPQTFLSKFLLPAYKTDYREVFTDDAAVVEAAGFDVHIVNGDVNNFKITTPLDLFVAEKLLEQP